MRLPRLALALVLVAGTSMAGTISGTLFDRDSGALLSGMTVSVYSATGTLAASGTSTATGTYSLTLPGGTYRILAYDPAGVFATSFYDDAESFETSRQIPLEAAENLTGIDFRLRHGAIIRGVVSDTSGALLGDMTVEAYNLSGTRRSFTTTDAVGSYSLVLPPGTFKVVAFDNTARYAKQFFSGQVRFETANGISVSPGAVSTADFHLSLAAVLRGTVVERSSLAPLQGIHVSAWGDDGLLSAESGTAADGTFVLASLPGNLRIVAFDPLGEYAALYYPDAESFSTAEVIAAAAGETVNLDMSLTRGGRITGRVIDAVTAAPVSGVTVAAFNADGTIRSSVVTDGGGNFSLLLPPGQYRAGTYDGTLHYLSLFYPGTADFSAATLLQVTADHVDASVNLALRLGARITGHVVRQTFNSPLSSMTVAAYDPTGSIIVNSVTTDSTGAYTLLLAPGSYKLVAFDPGNQYAEAFYQGASSFQATPTLTVQEAELLPNTDFAMQPDGWITGTVLDSASAAPLAGLQMVAFDSSGARIAETLTDTAGAFRLAVPPGTFIVAAADVSHRYGTMFYPQVTAFEMARAVSVAAFETVLSIDFRLVRLPEVRHRAILRHSGTAGLLGVIR
jgi:hypothetical protein